MQLQGAIAGFDIGQALDKAGARSPFAMVYTTRDDRHICLVLTNPKKEFKEVAGSLGLAEWADDERFSDTRSIMQNRDEVRDRFREAIRSRKLQDVCQAFDEMQLTYGVVESLSEVVRDAHLIENEIVVRTGSENPLFGWTINNPIRISGEARRVANDPPEYGQDTRTILEEHGFTSADIEQLLTDQIVFAAQ